MLAAATGKSIAELRALKLSGSHCWRNAGGEISNFLGWNEKDSNILGDWANNHDEGDDNRGRRSKTTKGVSTRERSYQPNATRIEQIAVRTRYLLAIRKAFETYAPSGDKDVTPGVHNITWDTTWLDLFPESPPEQLIEFYGDRPKTKRKLMRH